jgi:hypothetical protein
MVGLAAAFESVEIGPRFLPGQSRRITSAPFDLEVRETDQEENDEARVEQGIEEEAERAEEFAAETTRAAPEKPKAERREEVGGES